MINVLPANLSHIQEIFELEKSLFLGESYSLNTIKQELLNPNRVYLVAVGNDGVVAGYVGANITPDFAEIMKIGVSENFQRQGIAKAMFKSLVQTIKQKNMHTITLEVDHQNFNAISLYENLGFKQISTRKKYYKNGNDALIFVLTI